MAEPLIRGAKGASAPIEQSDTLRSTQRVEIVDLLGEGTIGGLVNGLKSVYLDGVPVENADGSRNVADFSYAIRLGGPLDTAPAHGFGDVQTEVAVNTNVTVLLPATRTVSDPTVDAVRVTLMFQGLMETLENGDRVGSAVEFAIEVQSNFGGFVQRWHDTVSGKASAQYPYAVRLEVRQWGPPPWDIRVRRITPDATTQNVLNAFGWLSYTVISGVKMLYRNSAAAWLSFDGANFASVPSRWYDVMGISDWDVPVNYDPLAHTVAGVWSGLFKQAWTSNPAWVLYGLVRNPRYGLGEYVAQLPDKWTLYALAQWCDGMLPDGRGGVEPRYSINCVINTQSEALALLQQICNIFRGVMTHSGSTLATTWDAPATPGALYAPANVKDGLFTYTDGSKGAKKSSCTCWYTDRTQAGKRVPVTWDDPDLIAKYGMRSMEIDPLGVATPAQAMRMAKWALFTNDVEDQTVSFSVGAQGLQTRLGEVFQVSDPSETDERMAGRVSAATTTQVTLDAPVTLVPGEAYTLWVTLPDSGDHKRTVVHSRALVNGPGAHQVLFLASALPSPPTPQTMWMLEGSNVQPTLWRCVGIAETGGVDGPLEFEITGLKYEPGKWALIEQDQPLTLRPTRRLGDGAPAVASVDLFEVVYIDGGQAFTSVQASWPMPAAGLRYVVAWRLGNGNWTTLQPSGANSVDIRGLSPGLFEIQVRSLTALSTLSPATSASLALAGYTGAPPAVQGLSYMIVSGGVVLAWTPCPDPLYAFTRLTYGPTFAGSEFFWEGSSSDFVVRPPADGVYTVWAQHFDRLGNGSAVPASLVVDYVALVGGSGDGKYKAFVFRRSAAAPATPTGNAPAGWFDAPPAADGTPLWVSVAEKQPDGTLIGAWSAPVQIEGAGITVQYSVDGATGWHNTFTPGDLYARHRVGVGAWEGPWRIVGEDGAPGTPGVDGVVWSVRATPETITRSKAGSFVPNAIQFNVYSNAGGAGPAAAQAYWSFYKGTGTTSYTWGTAISGFGSVYSGQSDLGVLLSATHTALKFEAYSDAGRTLLLDSIIVPILLEGSDAINVLLSNDPHSFPASVTGAVTSYAGSGTEVRVVQGATPLTYDGIGTAAGTWTVSTSATNITSGAITDSGNYATVGQASGVADGTDTASIVFTCSGKDLSGVSFTIPKTQSFTKSKAGAAGGTGGTGNTGQSNHRVYKSVTIGSPPSTPGTTVSGATPATWSPTPLTLTTGQEQYQSDGTTPAGSTTTTWGTPYPSYLKVGNLSAISADLGTVTAGNVNTSGYVQVEGSNSVSVPFLSGTASMAVAVAGNTSGSATSGVYGRSSNSAGAGVMGINTNTINGDGLYGEGKQGVTGIANSANGSGVFGYGAFTANSVAVEALANNSVAGTRAVQATADAPGQIAVKAISANGIALDVVGAAQVSGLCTLANLRINQTPTTGAVAASFAAVVSNKPAGSAAGSEAKWLAMNLNGTTYYFPVWT